MTTDAAAGDLPARPPTVLFDLDGTVLDSSRPVLAAVTRAFEAMDLPPLPADELHRVIGPPMTMAAPELLAERGCQDPAAHREFVERYRAAMDELEVEQAVAYDGVVDVVRRLADDGRRLAIVTSKSRGSTERVLPAIGVEDLFDHVEAPAREQPEPKSETMARAVRAIDVDPVRTVMVGDRRHDVEAATAHGIATIGVALGRARQRLRAARRGCRPGRQRSVRARDPARPRPTELIPARPSGHRAAPDTRHDGRVLPSPRSAPPPARRVVAHPVAWR